MADVGVTRLSEFDDIEHKFGMQDPDWRQCVYDHRLQLIDNSVTVEFTMEDAHYWRFRLQEFIKAKYEIPYDAVWIVFYLNNIQDIEYDGGILKILVPKLSYLEELHTAMSSNTTY